MAKLTIKQFLAALGISDVDKEVELSENTSSINEQQQETQQQETQQQTTQENAQTIDPEIAKLQKEISELKAVNARLLTQTPVEHQQTADEALLELLGIGVNEDGAESNS